ncbi:hypothetical protein ACHQM5_018545 [Ranunculus cassubicifolius]
MAALSSLFSTTQLGFQPFKSSSPNLTLISPIPPSRLSITSRNPTSLRLSNNGSLHVKEKQFAVLVKAGEGGDVEKKPEISVNVNLQGPSIFKILTVFVVFRIVFSFLGMILSWSVFFWLMTKF